MAETYFYVYKLSRDGENYIGYGITKDFESRNHTHQRTFAKNGVKAEKAFVKLCKTRATALDLEGHLKSKFSGLGIDIEGFKTESLPSNLADEFVEFVKCFDFTKEIPDVDNGPHRTTISRKMRQLSLNQSDLLDKKTALAFRLTYSQPAERFKYLSRLLDLQELLAVHGIKSKKDLGCLLGSLIVVAEKSP